MSIKDISTKAREYREIKIMIDQLETELDAIKAELIAELEARKADTIQADIFTIKHTPFTSNRIDTTALKKELPDVAARFTKTTQTKRFSVA